MLFHGPPVADERAAASGALVEIIPVSLERCGLVWLRPSRVRSWTVLWSPSSHPRQIVLDRLSEAGLQPAVVHSTSWRHGEGRLLLTHLAVLGSPPSRIEGFDAVPVRRCALARGGATSPPASIDVDQVVEHALRHLAWLMRDDALVQRCLGAPWRRVLDAYSLEPFRAMELEAPLVSGRR